jgi:CRISPR-associated protein Csb3
MNLQPGSTIRVEVDVSNPGQFFACCGLVELAEKIWHTDLLCWFSDHEFLICTASCKPCPESLEHLLRHVATEKVEQIDPNDETASPLYIAGHADLRLDWWCDGESASRALRTWAGSQSCYRIATAMRSAIGVASVTLAECFSYSVVVRDLNAPDKKVEPFYFDSRRGARPFSRDIGFAPDALKMTTPAYPVVEYLCLVGLQRCRPRPTQRQRLFDYFTWDATLPVVCLPTAVCGLLPAVGSRGFRFESAFRTDQRKHKAFSPAISLSRSRP